MGEAGEVSKELTELQKKQRKILHEYLFIPEKEAVKGRIKWNGKKPASIRVKEVKEMHARVSEAEDFVSRLIAKNTVDEDILEVGWKFERKQPRKGRAYFSFDYKGGSFNDMSLSYERSPVSTVIHEFFHGVDHNFRRIGLRSKRFLNERGAGEAKRYFYKDFPGHQYARDEVYVKDRFQNAYQGKVYTRETSSEITTMGVQQLYENPAKFALEDPEYFDFVVDVLRGYQ